MSWFRVLCLVCLSLLFVTASTHADTIKFDFNGNGKLDFKGPIVTSIKFQAMGIYDSSQGAFKSMSDGVIDLTVIESNSAAPNKGDFTIHFGGGDKLIGTFIGSVFPVDANGIARYVLTYTITSGMGLFRGATGSGSEELLQNFATSAYTSKGSFTITIPGGTAPIPEPATLLILGSGLAGLAMRLRKRE
ncbi:MAG TPA: PEP-CTERM sorting domain-containing protein [Blastocatellia bacterium]|nr:PEP-CTERM sorting domain-containing protein [Blastocatellia bacterium]